MIKNILKYAVVACASAFSALGIFLALPIVATGLGIMLLTGLFIFLTLWAINNFDLDKTKQFLSRQD